jgi:hypothetical protein
MEKNNAYKVEFYFDGTEDDAHSLCRILAQTIADEFEICRVYGVTVNIAKDGEDEHTQAD